MQYKVHAWPILPPQEKKKDEPLPGLSFSSRKLITSVGLHTHIPYLSLSLSLSGEESSKPANEEYH